MIGQTKKQSVTEAGINTLVGYIVSIISQEIIFPLFGVYLAFSQSLMMGLWFTIASVVRSYILRRVFNWWHTRNAWKDEGFIVDDYR